MATMIAYASYLPKKSDISSNAFLTAIGNSAFSIFAGFAVFGTLGFMAHQTGLPPGEVVKGGFGLAFIAYPNAIRMMPVLPQVIGVIFFLALVIAGLSSSISQIEGLVSSIMDKFGFKRRKIVTVIAIVGFLFGIIYTTQSGYFWLDIVDYFVSSYSLVLVGFLEAIVIGWIYGAKKLRLYINEVSNMKLGVWWDFCIKFLVPFVLLVSLILSIISEFKKSYGGYPRSAELVIGLGIVIITLVIGLIFNFKKEKQPISQEK